MKEQLWELSTRAAPPAEYSIIVGNLQLFILGSFFVVRDWKTLESISIELDDQLLPAIQYVQTFNRLEVVVCSVNQIFHIEVDGLNPMTFKKYCVDSLILYYKVVDSESICIVSTNELFYVKLLTDCDGDVRISELKDYNLFSFVRKEIVQIIGVEKIYFRDTLLLITLDTNARLKIWNLFSMNCLKTIVLEKQMMLNDIPTKLLQVYNVREHWNGFKFGLVANLPSDFCPKFAICEFEVDFNGSVLEFNINLIQCSANMIDFSIIQTEKYYLHVIFEDSLQFAELDNGKIMKWYNHQSLELLQVETLDLSDVYLKCSKQSILLALEIEDIETFNFEICRDLIHNFLHQRTVSCLEEKSGDGTSSMFDNDNDKEYQKEHYKQCHWFLTQVVELENRLNESVFMCYDKDLGVTLISKRGQNIGILRDYDIVEIIQFDSVASKEMLLSPLKNISDHLKVLKTPNLMNSLYQLNVLVDFIIKNLVLTDELDVVLSELTSNIAHETDIDEYAGQVFERIRDMEQEGDELFNFNNKKIRHLLSCVGPIEKVLNVLLTVFQHPNISQEFTEHPELTMTLLVANTLSQIISARYLYIKNVYFTLVILKKLSFPGSVSKKVFAQWQSLTSSYHRLNWLQSRPFLPKTSHLKSNQFEGKSLLALLIHHHIPFDLVYGLEKNLQAMAISILEKMDLSVANAPTLLQETGPVLKLANILINYCPSHIVQELLDMCSCATPAYCMLMAKLWLSMFEFEKARKWFLKAAAGVGSKISDLYLVDSPENCDSLNSYYEGVMHICFEKGALELAVFFGKLMISEYANRECDGMIQLVFSYSLDCSDFYSAYELIYKIQNSDAQKDCLRLLVGELCAQNEISMLVSTFSFCGFTAEVENTLLFKCRNENCSILRDSGYYKICYSYFTYRGDYRKAAEVMYLHAKKLLVLEYTSKVTDDLFANVWTRISQCLLTALGSLELVERSQSYLKVPKKQSRFETESYPQEKEHIELVGSDDIRKEYHLALAKLTLYTKIPYLKNFQLPDSDDIYTIYCSRFMFDHAIQTAILFRMSMKKLIEYVTTAVTNIINNRPCIFEYEAVTKGDLKTQIWSVLHSILQKHDSNTLELYQVAASSLLKKTPGYNLPSWLTEPLRANFPEILIKLFVENNDIEGAIREAISLLDRERTKQTSTHCSRWIPITLLEQILQGCTGQLKKRLTVAIADYQAEIIAAN